MGAIRGSSKRLLWCCNVNSPGLVRQWRWCWDHAVRRQGSQMGSALLQGWAAHTHTRTHAHTHRTRESTQVCANLHTVCVSGTQTHAYTHITCTVFHVFFRTCTPPLRITSPHSSLKSERTHTNYLIHFLQTSSPVSRYHVGQSQTNTSLMRDP